MSFTDEDRRRILYSLSEQAYEEIHQAHAAAVEGLEYASQATLWLSDICTSQQVERLDQALQKAEAEPQALPEMPDRSPNAYEQKQQARQERYEARAEAARAEAERRFGQARRIGDVIPMGQPILVGHHSERRHRSDLDKMRHNGMKGVEAMKRADYYDRRADSVGRGGIISDDPEAIPKLRAELEAVEAHQQHMKAVNAAHQRFLKDPASLDSAPFPEAVKQHIRTYKPAYSWEPHPYAPYQFQNNGANARRIRKRIEGLEKRQGEATSERTVGGVRVVDNVEANRLQLFFPGKPDEAMRANLKRWGFRWTPTLGCWQTQRGPSANLAANAILGVQ